MVTHEWKEHTYITNYTKKLVRNNLWKVANLGMEYWDLYNECCVVFLICKEKYKDVDDEEFMKIYKGAIINRIKDLIRQNYKEEIVKEFLTQEDRVIDVEAEANFKLKLEKAPYEIKKFIDTAESIKSMSIGPGENPLTVLKFLSGTTISRTRYDTEFFRDVKSFLNT